MVTSRSTTSSPARGAGLAAVLVGLLAGALAVPAGPAGAAGQRSVPRAAETRELVVDMEAARSGGEGTDVPTSGTVPATATVRTHGDGRVRRVAAPGDGHALRLPAFAAGATAATVPMAVLEVRPDEGASLDPGTDPFTLAATVRLDDRTTGSAVDDGDNLVQRGAFGDAAQVKLQVDGRLPSCRVKGEAGAVMVTAGARLRAGRWFRLSCRRTPSAVTLVRERLRRDGSVRSTRTWQRFGATGDLSGLPASTPLSIGGKLDAAGRPVTRSSDQLNGTVGEVVLDVG